MRLLLLNPNTSDSVTALIESAGRAAAASGTVITAMTAPRGVPYIATRAEAVLGGAIVLATLAEQHAGYDAAVIAAFGDPGLGGARELFPIPVVGLAEAGMLTACVFGRSFAIVTFFPALTPWYHEAVAAHGLQSRCAGVFTLDGPVGSIGRVQEDRGEDFLALARQAVAAGADVIIPGGAPLAGLAARVRDRLDVPVVDCVGAAVRMAETMVALGWTKPRAGTFRRPDAKASIGLPDGLADWIAHRR